MSMKKFDWKTDCLVAARETMSDGRMKEKRGLFFLVRSKWRREARLLDLKATGGSRMIGAAALLCFWRFSLFHGHPSTARTGEGQSTLSIS